MNAEETLSYAPDRIAAFNQQIFGGCLPPVCVVPTRARSFVGKFEYRRRGLFRQTVTDCRMRLSTAFDLTADELDDVIIHELIHCYIAVKAIRDTSVHGREFRRIMDGINARYGRHITVRHHQRPGQLPETHPKERMNYLCVSVLQDGAWGITSCAKTCLFQLRRDLPRYFPVREQHWYCSSDPFFNRLPRARTPKMYRMDRQETEKHLKGARHMEFSGRTCRIAE